MSKRLNLQELEESNISQLVDQEMLQVCGGTLSKAYSSNNTKGGKYKGKGGSSSSGKGKGKGKGKGYVHGGYKGKGICGF